MRMKGKVREVGGHYANGLERLEIHIDKDSSQGLPNEDGMRVPIKLVIGARQYTAGIRSTKRNPYVWICPNLTDDNNQRVSLSQALLNEEIAKNQNVELELSGNQIKVIPAS